MSISGYGKQSQVQRRLCPLKCERSLVKSMKFFLSAQKVKGNNHEQSDTCVFSVRICRKPWLHPHSTQGDVRAFSLRPAGHTLHTLFSCRLSERTIPGNADSIKQTLKPTHTPESRQFYVFLPYTGIFLNFRVKHSTFWCIQSIKDQVLLYYRNSGGFNKHTLYIRRIIVHMRKEIPRNPCRTISR